jgi:hypothetical protein
MGAKTNASQSALWVNFKALGAGMELAATETMASATASTAALYKDTRHNLLQVNPAIQPAHSTSKHNEPVQYWHCSRLHF